MQQQDNAKQKGDIRILHYALSIDGLLLRYNSNEGTTNARYDAFATCALFESLHLIEGFDTDGREPVILYEEEGVKPYGWCLWKEFVSTYPFGPAEATLLIYHHHQQYHPSMGKCGEQADTHQTKETLSPSHLSTFHQCFL